MANNSIGIIGGSGVYGLSDLSEVESLNLKTPFGEPSDQILAAELAGVKVYFISRHGRGHVHSPAEVNNRANIYALKNLGVNFILSLGAVGSLQEQLRPGDVVIPDQFIDRTKLRPNSFFGEGIVAHVPFSEPFCPVLRERALKVCKRVIKFRESSVKVHMGGTYLCMEGPQFSTRAESKLYREFGADIIGMTHMPEARLAREAEISYASICTVTDYDCWKETDPHGGSANPHGGSDVDIKSIFEILAKNKQLSLDIVKELVVSVSDLEQPASISRILDSAIITNGEAWPQKTKSKLEPLLARYLKDKVLNV